MRFENLENHLLEFESRRPHERREPVGIAFGDKCGGQNVEEQPRVWGSDDACGQMHSMTRAIERAFVALDGLGANSTTGGTNVPSSCSPRSKASNPTCF